MLSIICCTMRPTFMQNIFDNYERQSFENKEMLIILNRDDMDITLWREKAKHYKNVTVYKVPQKYMLGKCLNYGIARAKYDILAKFDDDDYYSPYYLQEGMNALKRTKSAIVGKHTSFVYFKDKKTLMQFRERGEDRYRRHLKGGTLLFHRQAWESVHFDEKRASASDADFLRRCKRSGFKIFSTSKYNYVCIRRKDTESHTQKTTTRNYMDKCKFIARTSDFIPITTKNTLK